MTPCLTDDELLKIALDSRSSAETSAVGHIAECSMCSEKLDQIRHAVVGIGSMPETAPTVRCLDDSEIASLAEGGQDPSGLAHAAACSSCRERLAAVSAMLSNASIQEEVAALDGQVKFRGPSARPPYRRAMMITAGLAAAAVATFVLLGPEQLLRPSANNRASIDSVRDAAITSTRGPHILSPADQGFAKDSLRWTSVPHADQYRVRIWNPDGQIVSTVETGATVVAIPPQLQRGRSYLWEVEARTGWDRWVSSEFLELKVPETPSH